MTFDTTEKEMRELFAAERRRNREAVQIFVDAVQSGEEERFIDSLQNCLILGVGSRAMRAVAKIQNVPDEIQRVALRVWVREGDSLRSEVRDDCALLDGLRVLLPRYGGAPMKLYHGTSWLNRCHRTYGLGWSISPSIAEGFAGGIWRTFEGGSVLLMTRAPTDAVICAVGNEDAYGEEEYLVDRRRLGVVNVLARYSQISPTEGELN